MATPVTSKDTNNSTLSETGFEIKSSLRKSKNPLRSTWVTINKYLVPGKKALHGAARGIFIAVVSITLFITLSYISTLGAGPVIVVSIILLLLSAIMGFLSVALLRLLNKIPFLFAVSIVAVVPVLMMWVHIKMPATLLIHFAIVFLAGITGGAIYLIRKQWKESDKVKKALLVTNLSIGIMGILAAVIWLAHPGVRIEVPDNARMSIENLPATLDIENPAQTGEYQVSFLSYGSGQDRHRSEYGDNVSLVTTAVDGSNFLEQWDGFSGKLRTRYFGFDKTKLPLNARVWYPEGEGPFGLVLVVHGNHLAQDFSDPGYEYLGRLLASRGFIMASVDENFLNGSYTDLFDGLNNENDARGWMLLKHLQVWRSWNSDSLNPFFGKVDMEKLALIGHSRGGEAVAHAALFNRLPFYPDNATETFDFNFNIRSIIAIAPVDGQYQPGKERTALTDINYLVLQGTHDADLSSYQGLRQFNRIRFSDDFQGFKAGIYAYAANHGQFNSVWGNKDLNIPRINLFNLKQLLPEQEQQQIAQVYISGFLEATLNNKQEYRPMFMDHRTARNWLPETVYINQYEQAGTQMICDFSEDFNLATATLPGSNIIAKDLSIWREQRLSLQWGDYDCKGVILGWNTKESDTLQPAYSIQLQPGSVRTGNQSMLVFGVAETSEKADPPKKKSDPAVSANTNNNKKEDNKDGDADNNKANEDDSNKEEDQDEKPEFIDFTIQLTDSNGGIVEFPLSSCAPLQPLLKRKFTKLPLFQTADESESILQQYHFPFEQMDLNGISFDFENITGINFIFNKTPSGVIAVNKIGFL